MTKRHYTLREIVEMFEVEERFVTELADEQIVCAFFEEGEAPPVPCFREADLERVRLAKLLTEEMNVNMAGVEVILRMRQNMFEMRRQFDAILEDLKGRMARHLKPSDR